MMASLAAIEIAETVPDPSLALTGGCGGGGSEWELLTGKPARSPSYSSATLLGVAMPTPRLVLRPTKPAMAPPSEFA